MTFVWGFSARAVRGPRSFARERLTESGRGNFCHRAAGGLIAVGPVIRAAGAVITLVRLPSRVVVRTYVMTGEAVNTSPSLSVIRRSSSREPPNGVRVPQTMWPLGRIETFVRK